MEEELAPETLSRPTPSRQSALSVLGWAAAAALVYVLARKVLHLDFVHALELIRRAGLVTVVIALPYPLAMAIDTFAGALILRTMGQRPRFRALYAIRLACEAVLLSLPIGTAFAESLNLLLLFRVAGVTPTSGIGFIVGKRWLLLRAHGIYVLLSALLGYAVLARLSQTLIHVDGLPFIVLGSTLLPFGIAAAMAATMAGGKAAGALARFAGKIPVARVQRWVKKRAEHFGETDVALARVLRLGRRPIWLYTSLLFGAWMMDTAETLLILRILGVHIGFVEVYSFEAGLSLVRSMAFFVPAGLGVQDLGYFAFFTALGVPDALGVGAAFVLLKRTKELFWVLVGYSVLVYLRVNIARRPHAVTAQAPP